MILHTALFRSTAVLAALLAPAVFAQMATLTVAAASGYKLGPDDQILIRVPEGFDSSDKSVLIGANGNITLPLIGHVMAAGLTVEQLEAELASRLKLYIQDPQVSVTVAEFRSQPVSVMGAVTTPGVFQLRGRKTLYEVLSLAGGPRDATLSRITLSRRRENGEIPLPGATLDSTERFFTAELDVQDVLEAKNPAGNIEIRPYDVLSLAQVNPRQVYIVGDVQHAGAFPLGSQKKLSLLVAISMAGGLGRTAKPERAKIFREIDGEPNRQGIPVNLKEVLAGKSEDLALLPNDVLVVPTSSRKTFTTYIVPATLASAVGAAIYTGARY
jgi:polysaccharide export outer membrane protein